MSHHDSAPRSTAPTIINTLWTATIGMVAVAGALAFGLGGRDLAKRLLEDAYERGKEKAEEVKESQHGSAPKPLPSPTTERRAA